MCQAVNVLQVLLVCRADFADAENRTRARPSIARLTAVRPIADKPPGAHRTLLLHSEIEWSLKPEKMDYKKGKTSIFGFSKKSLKVLLMDKPVSVVKFSSLMILKVLMFINWPLSSDRTD